MQHRWRFRKADCEFVLRSYLLSANPKIQFFGYSFPYQITFGHHSDQFPEVHLRLPVQVSSG